MKPPKRRQLVVGDSTLPLTSLEISLLRAVLDDAAVDPMRALSRMTPGASATLPGRRMASRILVSLRHFLLTGDVEDVPEVRGWRIANGGKFPAEPTTTVADDDPWMAEAQRRLASGGRG